MYVFVMTNAEADLNIRWENLSKGTFSDVAAHSTVDVAFQSFHHENMPI